MIIAVKDKGKKMAKYVKVNKATSYIKGYAKRSIDLGGFDLVDDTVTMCEGIEKMATEDVVEPVRCKECIHYLPKTSRCWRMCFPMTADDFCSLGERKAE